MRNRGEKIPGELGKRMKLFDWLVGKCEFWSGWGWKEWEKVERTQERYMRWVLGVNGRTPGCMVTEKGKREKMSEKMKRD